jgi:hypothetical protein
MVTAKRKIVRWLIVLTVLGGVAFLAYEYVTISRTLRNLPDAYAAWDTGTLIIEYMDTHAGKWPKSWNDLFSATATLERRHEILRSGPAAYLKFPGRVKVDWAAQPAELARAALVKDGRTPPFHVVTRPNGTDFPIVWSGAEPNRMIWWYLHRNDQPKRSEAGQSP